MSERETINQREGKNMIAYTGMKVKVIAGKYKGKEGTVIRWCAGHTPDLYLIRVNSMEIAVFENELEA